MKHWITTLTSRLGRTDVELEEGSVAAQIDADLDRFKGLNYLPGVLEQIRGHLRYWWGDGFMVEEDETRPTDVRVYFDGDVATLKHLMSGMLEFKQEDLKTFLRYYLHLWS